MRGSWHKVRVYVDTYINADGDEREGYFFDLTHRPGCGPGATRCRLETDFWPPESGEVPDVGDFEVRYMEDGEDVRLEWRTPKPAPAKGVCPDCGYEVSLLKNGALRAHDDPARPRQKCSGSGGIPWGRDAVSVLREHLERAFWEHYGLDCEDWGPDRDNVSAASTAVAALSAAPDFAVIGGVAMLITQAEQGKNGSWKITTNGGIA